MVGPQVRENLASGAGLRRVNGRETLNNLEPGIEYRYFRYLGRQ